ncbi:MAG: MFS transporter, partial [Caulobacteraceae bacterium]
MSVSAANATSQEAAGGTLAPGAPADPHEARKAKLGAGLLSVYGVGAMVDATTSVYLGTFLYFYLTAVCGMSGTLAGTALGAALVVDSVVDPLVGSLSDNSRSRLGRRHPFMAAAIVPIVVSLGLLFSVPAGMSGLTLLGYVVALTLAFRFGLSAFNVPYIALGAEISDDYNERSTIVAYRVGVGAIGTVATLILGYGVFLSNKDGGLLHRAGYAPFAWCGGAIVAVAAILCVIGTLRARARLHPLAADDGGAALWRFLREMGEVFRNRSFNILFGACLIFFVAQGASGALTLHANTFFWGLAPRQILVISLSGIPGLLVGIFVTALMTRWFEKRTIALIGLALICICQFSPVTLRLAGVVPATGAGPMSVLIASVFIASLGVAMAVVGFQSMMADAADEH